MSTDLQKYSTENQLHTIRLYAEQRGFTIVRVFEDSGRSGLRMDGRDGLQSLMLEVQSGAASFQAILVYDVSRWGRFQDADEGHITNTFALGRGSEFTIAANNLTMMGASARSSSKM
jgi:DNA invertase Pin-like site-specific DNA recombinase